MYGYKYAIENNADYIFQTDSDGQTNPLEFIDFWNDKDRFDVIVGNRKKRGDGILRFIIEKVVCILLKLCFGVSVPDANAPFRLMRRDVLEKYISRLPEDYYLPNIMLTCYFAYYGERICYKEISFTGRNTGKNNIDFLKISRIGVSALHDFMMFRKEMKRENKKTEGK